MLIKTKFEGYSPSGERVLPVFNYSTTAPEQWVTDIAKDIAGRATTLTDINTNPFQRFPGERVAPFSELQEDAFTRAGELTPSALTEQAGAQAGTATQRALGTSYDPYQMGQFTSQAAAQYMNPFVEMAMYPQLREAQRASEIQQQVDQAQAVRSGAFGGDRQAIVEAERQRNLGQQLGDIRARGYMSAFDQAQQQFAREQQLREQSRQYGAGLGLQGLQTALQGAGQMGALGGQQFGQARDVVGLQFGLGKEQQQLGQRQRDIEYQNFLNEERYPYQQLEFMSNIMRGTPMGTVQTMYTPPPSTMGQLAGLGIGLGGLASFGRMFKEGGKVQEYAGGGGVDDPDNVAKIVGGLSDAQLAQAKQAAQARGDFEQLQAIMVEEGMRASERSGLAGAFNQLPYKRQEEMMAGGGIVAFSNGGVSPEFDVGDPTAEGVRSVNLFDIGRLGRGGKSIEEYYGEPAFGSKTAAPEATSTAYADSSRGLDVIPTKATKKKAAPKSAPAAKPTVSAPARTSISDLAKQLDVPEKPLIDEFTAFQEAISAQNADRLKKYAEAVEKVTGGSKEVKEKALGAALAEFGFKWAAAAAKPGARFLSSLAEASPTLASSMAQSTKLAREMDQNDQRLRLNVEQLRLAEANNDSRTAMQLTTQNRVLRQAQQENALRKAALDEQIRSNTAKEGLMRSRIAAAGPAATAKASAAVMRNFETAQNNALNRAERRAAKDFPAAMLNPELQKSYKERGITTPAHLYQLYAQEELQRLTKQYVQNPVPDEDEDEDET